jgi:hypothetical protein
MNIDIIQATPTEELIKTKQQIDRVLRKRYHITNLPFHLLSQSILNRLDWFSCLNFLNVVSVYYKDDPEFILYHSYISTIGSIYEGIQKCADFILYRDRGLVSRHHVFCHWSPFAAEREALSLVEIYWSSTLPHARVDYNEKNIMRVATKMCKRRLYQLRFTVHRETRIKSATSCSINNKNKMIYTAPEYVNVVDFYKYMKESNPNFEKHFSIKKRRY